jgi:hypothetical protein
MDKFEAYLNRFRNTKKSLKRLALTTTAHEALGDHATTLSGERDITDRIGIADIATADPKARRRAEDRAAWLSQLESDKLITVKKENEEQGGTPFVAPTPVDLEGLVAKVLEAGGALSQGGTPPPTASFKATDRAGPRRPLGRSSLGPNPPVTKQPQEPKTNKVTPANVKAAAAKQRSKEARTQEEEEEEEEKPKEKPAYVDSSDEEAVITVRTLPAAQPLARGLPLLNIRPWCPRVACEGRPKLGGVYQSPHT